MNEDNGRDARNRQDVEAALGSIGSGISGALEGAAVLARHGWNLEMRALQHLGMISLFRARWWLFLVVGFLLLAFVFPLGVLFTLTAVCASLHDPKPEDDFIVPLRKADRSS